MKIRMGFISNSSSSSFIIADKDLVPKNFNSFEYKRYDGTILKISSKDIVDWIRRNYKRKIKVIDVVTESVISVFYDDAFDSILKKYLKERNIDLDWEEIAKDEKGRALRDVMITIFYTDLEINFNNFLENGNEIDFLRFLLRDFSRDVSKYLEGTYYFIFEEFDEVLEEDNPLKAIFSFKQWFGDYLYNFEKLRDISMKEVAEKMQELVSYLEKIIENTDREKIAYHLIDDVVEFNEYASRIINEIKELGLRYDEEVLLFEIFGNGDGWQDNIGSPMYDVDSKVWNKNNKAIYYGG